MESRQNENGAWGFEFDAEELTRASTLDSLAKMLSQIAPAPPPNAVVRKLFELLRTVPQDSVSSLMAHLGVLPEPSPDELASLGLTYPDLCDLTPQQQQDLALKLRFVGLAVTIGKDDLSHNSTSTPFYNILIADPWDRVWAVGKDFIDFG